MCAMWVGNCFKKCAVGKKLKTLGRLECRLSGLVNILFFCPFTMVYFSMFLCRCLFLTLGGNGYVYETFGISKHFLVKLQVLLIRAKTFDNPLTAKCFIYDVMRRISISSNFSPFIIFFYKIYKIRI